MQYGLMTYDYKKHFNVGDYIQSLAARQFLPEVHRYLNREHLNEYSGPKTKLIMNGWFMHNPESWPPSPDILPLFVSFHLTKRAAAIVLNRTNVSFLKKYEVGARDPSTLNFLKDKGINAYFSGCLTLTLGNIFHHQPSTDIYFVDVLHKPQFFGRRKRLIRKLFDADTVKSARRIQHNYPKHLFKTEESRFQLANDLLSSYQNAKLVVTSRLHCALPCLAMGTPVVFVNGYVSKEQIRLEGLEEFLNVITIYRGKVTANFDMKSIHNKKNHLEYADKLERRCKEFTQNAE